MRQQKNSQYLYSFSNSPGFTLIEILIVLAVIGILASWAYPSYQNSIQKTKRTEGRVALMQIMQQQERYYSQTNSYILFSSSSTTPEAKKFKWYSGDSAVNSSYELHAETCLNEDITACIQIIAESGTANVNKTFSDPVCGTLSLDSTGKKLPINRECW